MMSKRNSRPDGFKVTALTFTSATPRRRPSQTAGVTHDRPTPAGLAAGGRPGVARKGGAHV